MDMQIIRKIPPRVDPWERIDFEKQGGGKTDTLKGVTPTGVGLTPSSGGSTDTLFLNRNILVNYKAI